MFRFSPDLLTPHGFHMIDALAIAQPAE